MIAKANFSVEHIRDLQRESKRDPILLERTLYAFGLLEALSRVGLPFIFKGGTSLMLLLEHPMRLSTDIDIVVAPDEDIDHFIREAGKIFPFASCEEQIRHGHNDIEKRHFKFQYDSPINQRPFYILLDVVFEENHYARLVEKPIRNELLLLDDGAEDQLVRMPDANCMIGDKLTAFAPHTTGISFGIQKEMEIIKQMYDISTLLEVMDDFSLVRETYLDPRNVFGCSGDRDSLSRDRCHGTRLLARYVGHSALHLEPWENSSRGLSAFTRWHPADHRTYLS